MFPSWGWGLYLTLEAITNPRWLIQPPRQDLRIEVTGNAGTKVDATFQADGVVSTQATNLPATFHFRARQISFTISQGQDGGELSAMVFADEQLWNTISCHSPGYVSAFIDGVDKDAARSGGTTVGAGPGLGYLDDPNVPGSPKAHARRFWSLLIAWVIAGVYVLYVLVVLCVTVTRFRPIRQVEPGAAPNRGKFGAV